jgi:hypothetical protein
MVRKYANGYMRALRLRVGNQQRAERHDLVFFVPGNQSPNGSHNSWQMYPLARIVRIGHGNPFGSSGGDSYAGREILRAR